MPWKLCTFIQWYSSLVYEVEETLYCLQVVHGHVGCKCYSKNNISDDAHSHLCGYAKKQHCQYYSNEQLGHMFRKLLHSLPVTTSYTVPAFEINGPHFFEEGNHRVPVNSAWHWVMLKTKLDTANFDSELWFQQVSATEHTARVPICCLRPMFPGCIMSCFGDTALPASSPDLSTTHYLIQDTWKPKFMQTNWYTWRGGGALKCRSQSHWEMSAANNYGYF